MVECWDKIKERYDVAFIGAAATIVIGIAFIFFTIVVSDWMFPNRNINKGAEPSSEEPEPVAKSALKSENCTQKIEDTAKSGNDTAGNNSSTAGEVPVEFGTEVGDGG